MKRWLLSPVIFVPLLVVAAISGVMLVTSALAEDSTPNTAALYAPPTEGTSSQTATGAPSTGAPVEGAPVDPVLLASPTRMRIERLGVDAGLVTLGVDTSTGNMAAPDGPELVGWYDFTARPGSGTGNAVFAGHRDWRDYGPAVFFDLEDLEPGDVIEVELAEGSLVRYTVTATHTYPVEDLDMREILAPTDEETITLITCAGAFEAHDYTDRHIVRAVRTEVVPASVAASQTH